MTNRPTTVLLLAALALAACGGGGGGGGGTPTDNGGTPAASGGGESGTTLPFPLGLTPVRSNQACLFCAEHYAVHSGLPQQAEADAQRAPVYHEHGRFDGGTYRQRLFVGVHQGDEHLGSLPSSGQRDGALIRYGRLNDGVDATTVASYLEGGLLDDGQVRRHASPPVLRVVGTPGPEHTERLVRAVQLVNAALPPDWRITMPADGGLFARGSIEVEFMPSLAAGAGETHYWVDFADAGHGLDRARIEIDLSNYTMGDERLAVQVLAHEIMHALGMLGHLPEHFDTILEAHNPGPRQDAVQPLSILYIEDRDALRALYGRLDNGDTPSVGLSPWSSSSLHIAGNGRYANFGVALRNGYAEPWAHGYLPDGELADNGTLGGSANWSGALLGFTPDAQAVAGDAVIGVNLGTLTGRADFTNLEAWAENAAPGAAGTGATWGDGTLGYVIAVMGNTFRETGGDAGRLTGIFTGAAHVGAAGTIERSDLTAAFGASRE